MNLIAALLVASRSYYRQERIDPDAENITDPSHYIIDHTNAELGMIVTGACGSFSDAPTGVQIWCISEYILLTIIYSQQDIFRYFP
ncbi:hypothetical protein [Pseudomonas fildesensis]|nr:hypothetical protein [Pseudomonas fildesensis]